MKQKIKITALTLLCALLAFGQGSTATDLEAATVMAHAQSEDYIKYIDFTPTFEALRDCMEADITSYGQKNHTDWVTLLALLASENYGNFKTYKRADLMSLLSLLQTAKPTELVKNQKLYSYYTEAYGAILGGMVGEYTAVCTQADGSVTEEKCYGLRVFSPIAAGYSYTDYDDFGSSRSYGYKREHLGHDLLGSVGTPVVAVESGIIVHLGWNQYGGWRVGIRSFDGKRYYYYAHLRKGHPYPDDLYEGKTVHAGEVIGYLGMTGYSKKEDVNGIDTPHLHYGLQIIFHPDQVEGWNQIWCDLYALTRLLSLNRAKTTAKESERVTACYYLYPETPD